MPDEHRSFLISFEQRTPDWSLLGVDVAPEPPAVRWRQKNLDTLDGRTRNELVLRLEKVLQRQARG
ncbi:MAG: hypothetical protein IRY94_01910 [Rhodospirillaceae bacterium]|nr:hypothetical protein [Rhodospirillaceae bacterium]